MTDDAPTTDTPPAPTTEATPVPLDAPAEPAPATAGNPTDEAAPAVTEGPLAHLAAEFKAWFADVEADAEAILAWIEARLP